jgi:hypothetical protein
MKNSLVLLCSALVFTGCVRGGEGPVPDSPQVFSIEDFGAVGDGVHNDAPALKKAFQTLEKIKKPVRLVFSEKTYRLGKQDVSDAQFDFSGLENIEVDGQGATLIIHPVHGVARVFNSRNITFKNFVIQHDPLPFMQGTILSVAPDEGFFVLKIQDGFPLPPSEQWMKDEGHFFDNPASEIPDRTGWETRVASGSAWRWGAVMESASRALKRDFPNHLFIQNVVPAGTGDERTFRVYATDPYKVYLADIVPGERFILPRFRRTKEEYFNLKDKGWMYEQNVQVRKSSDITIENLTFYSVRPGMVFGVRHNIGPVTVRGCTVTWLPGSDRLIASWRDGVHCKNNRIGPVIENCHFEGLFDDSINLSADAVMAKKVISSRRFELTSAGFEAGDRVGVFRPDLGSWDTGFSVVEADGSVVTLDRPVDGVIPGEMRPRTDVTSTHFYNLSCANDGFVVRNNFFGIQRRHAVLARCRGLIENNVIDGVCGRALEFSNESGGFYEGPFPRGLRVINNRISNTAMAPVVIRTKGPDGMGPVTGDILFENNQIIFDDGAPVELECVENMVFKGNVFSRTDGTPVSNQDAVQVDSSSSDILFE